MQVPPGCFLPPPKVGSTVVCLKTLPDRLPENEEKLLFRMIRAAFSQRRKTLYNSLGNAPELSCSREQIAQAISECGLRRDIRGEALSLEQFIELGRRLV